MQVATSFTTVIEPIMSLDTSLMKLFLSGNKNVALLGLDWTSVSYPVFFTFNFVDLDKESSTLRSSSALS